MLKLDETEDYNKELFIFNIWNSVWNFKKFHHPDLRKIQITINFYGKFGHHDEITY